MSRKVTYAKAVCGKRGDIILKLPDGKVAFPLGFTPREGEEYYVEIVEEREKYAKVQLHAHDYAVNVRLDNNYYYVEVYCRKCSQRIYGWNPGLVDWYEARVPREVLQLIPNFEELRRHNIETKAREEKRKEYEEKVKRWKAEFVRNMFRDIRGETVVNVYETPRYYYIYVKTLREPERRCVRRMCAKRCICEKEEYKPGVALFERVDKKTFRREIVEVPFEYVTVWEEEGFTSEPYRRPLYRFDEPAKHVTLTRDYGIDEVLKFIDESFASLLQSA